jgi:hypothetical protein
MAEKFVKNNMKTNIFNNLLIIFKKLHLRETKIEFMLDLI